MESIYFYESYHLNPINKIIHFTFIPIIMVTTMNFSSLFRFRLNISLTENFCHFRQVNIDISGEKILYLFYLYYYFTYSRKIGMTMSIFLNFIYLISFFHRSYGSMYYFGSPIWQTNSSILFTFAWIMQFIGHAIEGNRPALFTGFKQSLLQSPLFVVEYVYPHLLDDIY
jgi:uncharacterized membrane protein YGL010W